MRTIRIKVYKFSELVQSAKEEAIKKLADINVMFDWWDSTYEDAENIGLKIVESDSYRAKGHFINGAFECANAIIKEHGEKCDTRQTAVKFLADFEQLTTLHFGQPDYDDRLTDLEDQFLDSLLNNYCQMLVREYDYLVSPEAIIETIEANEYEFTSEGRIFHQKKENSTT